LIVYAGGVVLRITVTKVTLSKTKQVVHLR